MSLSALLRTAVLLTATVGGALLLHRLLIRLLRRVSRTYGSLEASLVRRGRRPFRLVLVIAALLLAVPLLPVPAGARAVAGHVLLIGLILALAWLVIGLSAVSEFFVQERYRTDIPDNLRARRIRTKVQLLRRIVTAAVSILALAFILMTFPAVRQVGVSLFASAGILGIIIGIAARPTLSNLIAGLQVALSEPIRLDDVVIVEGEWGWVEEIRMTYVVVRLWDLRRLVVPLSYFIDNPFQNWTRRTAEVLGTVYLHADYRVPVDALREELGRILQETHLWDGKVFNLQVTGATDRTVELRALMSAPDAPTAWNLRCHVRERLLAYLQREHPECLPRVRGEIVTADRAGTPELAPVGRPDGASDRDGGGFEER